MLRRLLAACTFVFPVTARAAEPIDFTRDVAPIFAKHCVACHGPGKPRGGLRLDDRKSALAGGNSGAVVVPGRADQSLLLRAVAGRDADLKMPPKEKPPLTAEEVATLRGWIDQG